MLNSSSKELDAEKFENKIDNLNLNQKNEDSCTLTFSVTH